jgi:hypothetical protein
MGQPTKNRSHLESKMGGILKKIYIITDCTIASCHQHANKTKCTQFFLGKKIVPFSCLMKCFFKYLIK